MQSKFDSYGIRKGVVPYDIKAGDTVFYVFNELDGKKMKEATISGIWDGEKVEFSDNKQTIVRTIKWLHIAL